MKGSRLVLSLAAAVAVTGGVTAGIVSATQTPNVPPLPSVSPGAPLPYLSDLPNATGHKLLDCSGRGPEPSSKVISLMAESGACDRPVAIYLKEEGTKATIGVIARKPAGTQEICTLQAVIHRLTVHLASPFGHRVLEHAKYD